MRPTRMRRVVTAEHSRAHAMLTSRASRRCSEGRTRDAGRINNIIARGVAS
jgi:hypothetical protein